MDDTGNFLYIVSQEQSSFFLRFYLLYFLEREREGEKHQCVVASPVPLTGDLDRHPGMCPDWESHR